MKHIPFFKYRIIKDDADTWSEAMIQDILQDIKIIKDPKVLAKIASTAIDTINDSEIKNKSYKYAEAVESILWDTANKIKRLREWIQL